MLYRIRFQTRALKDLRKLERYDAKRIIDAIEKLESDLSGDVKKLTAHSPKYRLRIGQFRVLFDIERDEITIHRVKDRREAY